MNSNRIMRSGALSNGKSAYGYRFLKPGFSFSEQMDLAFALGFPSLTFVVDGHPDDADPLANLDKWRASKHACLPATVALYLVRDHAWSYPMVHGDEGAPWLATKDEPLGTAEMKRLVPQCLDEMHSVHAVYRWEALSSTDQVLSILIEEFERQVANMDSAKLEDTCNVQVVQSAIPVMLLRVTEGARGAFRERLAALRERLRRAPDMQQAIAVAVDHPEGDKGQRFRGHGAAPAEYVKWLQADEIDESCYPTVRDAFVGGDRAIEVMRKRWREYNSHAREHIVSQYGWVRSEQTVLLFLDVLGSAPKLKASVKEWFVEHADYARPILLDLEKKPGPSALLAKKALKDLDGVLGRSRPAAEKAEPKGSGDATPKKTGEKKAAKKGPAKKAVAKKVSKRG